MTVLPTIGWAGADSFNWCFDGEPVGGVVTVSTTMTQKNRMDKTAFLYGYDAMLERLNPSCILLFGVIPHGLRGNIINVPPRWKTMAGRRIAAKARWENADDTARIKIGKIAH